MTLRLLVCLVVMSFASVAAADPALRQAKAHFHEGETAYTLGKFDKALTEFSAAYEAKPLPGFLFNIAQCHRQLKHWERAVFFYEGYLRQIPDAPNRALVSDLLKEARANHDKEEAEEKRRQQQKQQQEQDEERARAAIQYQPGAPATQAFTQPTEPPVPATPLYKKGWFWGTMVGVAAVVAGGTVLAIYFLDPKNIPPSGSAGTINRAR